MQIKYYKGGIAVRSLMSKEVADRAVAVYPFKTIDNTQVGYLMWTNNPSYWDNCDFKNRWTYKGFANIYASTDSEFNVDEYSPQNTIGTTTFVSTSGLAGISHRISVTNNTAAEISVKSFKITKSLCVYVNSDNPDKETLIMFVTLDAPVKISAGHAKDFVIDFSFLNE